MISEEQFQNELDLIIANAVREDVGDGDHTSLACIPADDRSSANLLVKDADVVLVVGSRLQDFTTASKQGFAENAKILHLNVSQYDGLKMDSVALQADAKSGLEALHNALQTEGSQTSPEYRERIAQLQAEWNAEVDRLYQLTSAEGNVQSLIVGALNEFMAPEDVILCAAGSLPGDLHRLWRSELPKNYHMEYGYSCMGYEIAAGLGVKLAHPEREVVVMVGDGSYMMANSEIATSVMLGLKIILVILDNRGFACINRLPVGCGGEPFNNLLDDARHSVPAAIDFRGHAESQGAVSEKVDSLAGLDAAMKRAKASETTYAIVIDTDPLISTEAGGAWWDVAVAEVSDSETVRAARQDYETAKTKQRLGD